MGYFVLRERETGETSKVSLEHRYESIAHINLNATVPEEVCSQFNIAKMLCVYAWLYYPLHQVAELKAFSTLEMALRLRYPEGGPMLKRLLAHAVKAGAITDHGFSHIKAELNDPLRYSKNLPDIIPSLRNSLAHGTTLLHPQSVFTLRNCSEIINQLYPTVPKAHEKK